MYTILIIDDDAVCREMLTGAVEKLGFASVCASEGGEALRLMEKQNFDLVLLDAQMPGMNGETYLQAIRRDARFRRLPVLMLTDSASKETVSKVLQLGVQGYLLKGNLSLEELVGRIKRCLAPDMQRLLAPEPKPAPKRHAV